MGMHDSFMPKKEFCCPVCSNELEIWQSKELDCLLYIWKEGELNPSGSTADPENLSPSYFEAYISEPEFMIYSFDCSCPYPTYLKCRVKNNVWNSTELFTGTEEDRKLYGAETRSNFKQRMKWLNKEL